MFNLASRKTSAKDRSAGSKAPVYGRTVTIDHSLKGYIVHEGGQPRYVESTNRWSAPSLAVQEIPPDTFTACSIIIAWLAYPAIERSSDRFKAAMALCVDAYYDAWKTGYIDRKSIPEWGRDGNLSKAKRKRLAATANRFAQKRVLDADEMLMPLQWRDTVDGVKVKWTGTNQLNQIIEKVDPQNGWRTWRSLIPVAHLALAVGQRFADVNAHAQAKEGVRFLSEKSKINLKYWPTDLESLSFLLKQTEATRTGLTAILKPANTFALARTIQFRPVFDKTVDI
jgi:hypothetical protein